MCTETILRAISFKSDMKLLLSLFLHISFCERQDGTYSLAARTLSIMGKPLSGHCLESCKNTRIMCVCVCVYLWIYRPSDKSSDRLMLIKWYMYRPDNFYKGKSAGLYICLRVCVCVCVYTKHAIAYIIIKGDLDTSTDWPHHIP